MCGIIAYVGPRAAAPILLDGLSRLEYRGYDSAGVATMAEGKLNLRRVAGRVADLEALITRQPAPGSIGIGHTRWATHGSPTELNAHPHLGGKGEVIVAHNGVIENYSVLRARLQEKGFKFVSETDTEVIAHLIASHLDTQAADPQAALVAAVDAALPQLKGTYGLAIFSPRCPGFMIGARVGSPLIVGVGKGENFLASDMAALVKNTAQIVVLNDREMALVTANGFEVRHRDRGSVRPSISQIEIDAADTEKGNFPHFMLKEIFEQPEALRNAMRGRVDEDNATGVFGGLNLTPQQLRSVNRIVLTGCGTSWHAAIVGKYLIEEMAGIPVEVEYASEMRYRNPPIEAGTLLFALAQSGETADTLAALRESKRRGVPTLGIVNVVGSTIARESDGGIYLHAGPEIGVAATKTFSCQVMVLSLLALHLGRLGRLSHSVGSRIIHQIKSMPEMVEKVLARNEEIKAIAKKYVSSSNMLFLGRGFCFPIALEGALKLKEISYIHAEGYPAAEIKHGPIALIDEKTPSVLLVPRGLLYDKMMSTLEEVRARHGKVIAVATEGDQEILSRADDVLWIPDVSDSLTPILAAVPLQLLAYHTAVLRGCDVDKPRNLAKSVTVE